MTCKDCISCDVCKLKEEKVSLGTRVEELVADSFNCFKNKADFVEVVRCSQCKYGRKIDKNRSPEKYFRNDCVVCECEDVVEDEPMIYPPTHFCSYGKGEVHNVT